MNNDRERIAIISNRKNVSIHDFNFLILKIWQFELCVNRSVSYQLSHFFSQVYRIIFWFKLFSNIIKNCLTIKSLNYKIEKFILTKLTQLVQISTHFSEGRGFEFRVRIIRSSGFMDLCAFVYSLTIEGNILQGVKPTNLHLAGGVDYGQPTLILRRGWPCPILDIKKL